MFRDYETALTRELSAEWRTSRELRVDLTQSAAHHILDDVYWQQECEATVSNCERSLRVLTSICRPRRCVIDDTVMDRRPSHEREVCIVSSAVKIVVMRGAGPQLRRPLPQPGRPLPIEHRCPTQCDHNHTRNRTKARSSQPNAQRIRSSAYLLPCPSELAASLCSTFTQECRPRHCAW
jgi:hypothetical protein